MAIQTSAQPEKQQVEQARLPRYQQILLATDSSDHANRSLSEAIGLAKQYGANITAVHVYAAKMHNVRFRHMEGGLPEKFRQEQELERQRDVHDDLITRGLSIISDSYLDQVATACDESAIQLTRCVLEGKNYRALVTETNNGHHDLLIMGALGLGAIEGSRLGSVCLRVVRRTDIDTLVIKEPGRSIAEGPIVVAIDGSTRSCGGLLTALSLARQWGVAVKVVAAFDPYFHYVAFNRIANVLSEEAGKVFRFKDQEKLHEEIIDSGLAKIYQSHLDVATTVAREYGMNVETVLLDGKPHDAIAKYLRQVNPALLVIGKTGIHADRDLDIGGNAENLLHDVDCAVLLSQREFQPRVDIVADATTSWTIEAEHAMQKVPSFVRNMARMAILLYAREHGHTVITGKIVEQTTAELCPSHARQAMAGIVAAHDAEKTGSESITESVKSELAGNSGLLDSDPVFSGVPMTWTDAATTLLETVVNGSVRRNLRRRAEKKARTEDCSVVATEHIEFFLHTPDSSTALRQSSCPFAALAGKKGFDPASRQPDIDTEQGFVMPWSDAAKLKLANVPLGFCRDMTRTAAETIAVQQRISEISADFIDQVMQTFEAGAKQAVETMPWDDAARTRIAKAPDMIRGMLVKEIEAWAQRQALERVNEDAVQAVKKQWAEQGQFHLDPNDSRRNM